MTFDTATVSLLIYSAAIVAQEGRKVTKTRNKRWPRRARDALRCPTRKQRESEVKEQKRIRYMTLQNMYHCPLKALWGC